MKTRIGCYGSFLLLLVIYSIWVSLPGDYNAAAMAQARENFSKRFAEEQKDANDPAKNGYLNPTLRGFWGIKSESDPKNAAGAAVHAWNSKYSYPALGKLVDHKALLAQKDSDYLQARAGFEKVLPELSQALARPVWTVPLAQVSYSSPCANFISLRASAQALAGYADSLAAEGRSDEAIVVPLPIRQLAHNLEGQVLIQDMIGVAMRVIIDDAILRAVKAGNVHQSQTWTTIMQSVQDTFPAEHQLSRSLEGEAYMTEQLFRDPVQNMGDAAQINPVGLKLVRVTGLLARERRLYENRMGDLLAASGREEIPSVPYEPISAAGWLLGRTGFVADLLTPNFIRCGQQMALVRRYDVAVHTLAGLKLYQAQKGAFPDKLEQLADIGLKPLPGFDWKKADWYRYQRTDKGALLVVKVDNAVLEGTGTKAYNHFTDDIRTLESDGIGYQVL